MGQIRWILMLCPVTGHLAPTPFTVDEDDFPKMQRGEPDAGGWSGGYTNCVLCGQEHPLPTPQQAVLGGPVEAPPAG